MQSNSQLTRSMSPLSAWAYAIGTSIGWGSFVITSNTYLAQAGPWGSTIGMVLGGLIMLVISANYAYLMNIYPDAGGAYAYCREVYGHDYGFLTAWFLVLTYLAVLWANATSLPLFSRYFLGNVFNVGKLYTVFGYDVYLGEALLSALSIAIVALLCARFKRAVEGTMSLMSCLFTAGIVICFIVALRGHRGGIEPRYVPDSTAFSQIIHIAVISPWAFIGFESISHSAEEMNFRHTRFFRILVITVISTTLLYIFVTLLSVTAFPPEYDSWLDYIRNRQSLEGIKALPAFYAANHYMGRAGVDILMASLLCLILTSLVGNITAVSRLLFALARDSVIPRRYARVNRQGVPGRAIALVVAVSAFFPFLGRTAIGWIVDVTTIGATLVYGMVSASTAKLARERRDWTQLGTGIAGLAIMIGFALYLTVPNLFTAGQMEPESYFLFAVWATLGLLYFNLLLRRDRERRFGNSIVVWIALFSLILFISLVWLTQSILTSSSAGMNRIEEYYMNTGLIQERTGIINNQILAVRRAGGRSAVTVIAMIALSMGCLISVFHIMSRRMQASERQLDVVQAIASKDPLTGVKSRHAFAEKEKALDEQISGGGAEPFGIVVCDLNGLKFINDTLGHRAGDERIKQASRIICEFFSHSPVYRNGGDEFVVYLTGRDFEYRDSILEALHQMSVDNIETGEVVISAGLGVYTPGSDPRLRPVFERADAAMYREKMALKAMGAKTR